MRARLLLALALAACGAPATPPPRAPIPEPELVPEPEPEPIATPLPGPCALTPPSPERLARPAQPGLLLVDAAAPLELGACISPALVLREGEPNCEPSGLRCRVGDHHVLVAREQGDACVPIALVTHAEPLDADAIEAALAAAIAMRDEACALHDRVVRADPALYADVTRARRIAPAGRRAELAFECLTGEAATALAAEVRRRFEPAPLRCSGLRCQSEPLGDEPPAGSLLFAHRLAGPLRFDGVAWLASSADRPRALQLLRRRCR